MANTIRLLRAEMYNIKNVKKGILNMNATAGSPYKADVIGLYGQNGSGKTALVEGFDLLKKLISGNESLPSEAGRLIYHGEPSMKLIFDFYIENELGTYFMKYTVVLVRANGYLNVAKEEMKYRQNEKSRRFKTIAKKDGDVLAIRNKKIKDFGEEVKTDIMVANKLAAKEATSFLFRDELCKIYPQFLDEVELAIVGNLVNEFNHDFHVIDAKKYGYLIAKIMISFNIHLKNARGELPYDMTDPMLLPVEVFQTFKEEIQYTNIVLEKIIPGLQVKIHEIHRQMLDNGENGVKFEFLSKKDNIELPLRSESAGTLKIISILSTLIAVYNNPNALVVIDELDASVFEYLLGEILGIIDENGNGQLIFTSHNLRILEVLPKENLWFTTTNPDNRFIQLKGIKKNSNARDIYLRAVQLGGQDEAIYAETDAYDIKKSFRKAGIMNDEN